MKLRKRQPLRTGRQQFRRQRHPPSMLSGVHATSQGGILNRACAQGGSYTCSKVLKPTPGATLTTLYSFCSQTGCTDGRSAGLVQATDGNFYGTTSNGGAHGHGTVFEITAGAR